MCSIEEAWAGQLFEGRKVQSQADLHRKYMPISDNLLERNNEFTINRKEPQSREGVHGLNTKHYSQRAYPNTLPTATSQYTQPIPYEGNMHVDFASNMPIKSNYGGEEPRPGYMSIYDNANEIPMPSMTTIAGKDNFNDINQAFTVSKTVDNFMNQARQNEQNNIDDVNVLLNEDNDMDKKILKRKFKSLNNEAFINNNNNNNNSNSNQMDVVQFQKTLRDILQRLDGLENKMQHNNTRNMYDMVLYILVGMLISFIIYAILRK